MDVDVPAVLGGLGLRDDLEPDRRTRALRVGDAVGTLAELVLRQPDRAVEVVPAVEAGRRRGDDVVQRLGPEVRERRGGPAVDDELVGDGHARRLARRTDTPQPRYT